MRRLLRLFLVAVLAAFCVSANVSAAGGIELVSLEPTFTSDAIEINETPEGYNFSATLLDSDLELKYKAVIKNAENNSIKIESISVSNSSYEFLEYSYDGITAGDVLAKDESRTIELAIHTNAAEKQSVSEDYSLSFSYSISDNGTNPPTSDYMFGAVVTIIIAGLLSVVLIKRNPRRVRSVAILLALVPCAGLIIANAHAATNSFEIKGQINFTRIFDVFIDPNGGDYDGHTELFSTKVRDGGVFHLNNPTHESLSFVRWEVNPSNSINDNNDLTVHSNIIAKALWNEQYHTLTIDPRGGEYMGVPGVVSMSYRLAEVVSLATPTKTGFDFEHWTDDDDALYSNNTIVMDADHSLFANYGNLYLNVVVNPNGGTFNNSENITTLSVKYGDEVDLSNISRPEYVFTHWQKQNGATFTESSIIVKYDMELTANWRRTSNFTITIDPNGGAYNGSTEVAVYTIAAEGPFIISEDIKRDNYVFTGWSFEDGSILDGSIININRDINLKATWAPPVARIGETLFASIMDAETAAVENDTIVLLIDTREEVTNTKKVTLDLDGHTVIGSIYNSSTGNLTLINGTIENPHGTAVTNDGVFTMGIDDLKADGTSNIINDNVVLLGTDVGLQQNNIFYFYDGYIEGGLALVGGYDSAPYYRNTFDNTIVYYFPFVDHNYEKDCQHVQLESSDRAVTKTTVHGDIYYYNAQDNIDTSSVTGYKIYAVRSFDASYPLTVNEGITIDFDIVGYTVHLGDTLTNNGILNIMDGRDNIGVLQASKTIVNESKLNLNNVTVKGVSREPLMHNKKELTLVNSTLTATSGYTYNSVTNGATVEMDDNSQFTSESRDYAVVYNSANDFEIHNGNINGIWRAVYVEKGTFTVNGGNIKSESNNTSNSAIYVGGATVIVNAGNVTAITNSPDGNPSGNNGANAYAFEVHGGNLQVNGGNIRADGNSLSGSRRAVYMYDGKTTLNGGNYVVTHSTVEGVNNPTYPTSYVASLGRYQSGFEHHSVSLTITGGTYNVSSQKMAYGVYNDYSNQDFSFIMSNGDMTITAPSAYGVRSGVNTISGGSINVVATTTGYGIDSGSNTITGGKIHATTYGIYAGTTTLGSNDDTINISNPEIVGDAYALYQGSVNFYDGVLKGKVAAYTESSIYSLALETRIFEEVQQIGGEDYYVDYLVEQIDLIKNGDTYYKSLVRAIEEAAEGDTLTAIHDIMNTDNITVSSDKNVIFDLDGHDFRSSKSIVNNGTFTITNNSDETSLLRFFGSDYYIVNNEGASLTLSNIEIESNKILKNSASATAIINNVPFTANDVAIYNLGALNATTVTIASSGSYAIYSSSAESSAVNGATITGYVLNNSGTLDFANSTLSLTVQSYGRETYANKGQSTLDNVAISLATLSADNRDSSNSVINNSGTMTIKSNSSVSATINTSNIKNYSINNSGTLTVDHSTINAERSSTSSRYGSYGLYNTGNATLKDSAIVVNDPTTAYGIYSNAGIAAIETGTITASSVTAYGAYINGGEVTAGVPEVVGSPTYGHDTANVSITNPLIYAIGTSTGIGIKNANGSFNYYDGKLMGSTAAKPEIPTKIEYLYEAFDYVDSETGHPYCILEWMREQP